MLPLIGALMPLIGKIIDRVIPDKAAADQAKLEALTTLSTTAASELGAITAVIKAEANSASWITRSWRPITMLMFVAIIANNYIIVPYAQAFGAPLPTLDIPPDMWTLLQLGLGGYVASRGAEKVVQIWKDKS